MNAPLLKLTPPTILLVTAILWAPAASSQIFAPAALIPPDDPPDNQADGLTEARTTFKVVGDGSLVSAPSSETGEEDGTPATARVGLQVSSPRLASVLAAQISVVSTEETLADGAAAAILTPGTGGGVFESAFVYGARRISRMFKAEELVANTYAYFSGSSANWSVASVMARDAEELDVSVDSLMVLRALDRTDERVGVFGGGGGLRVDVLPNGPGSTVGISVNLGAGFRTLGGDVGAPRMTGFRKLLIGTDQTTFLGIETGVQVRVNDVSGGVQLYRYNADSDVPGMGGLRLVAGIGATVSLFGE